MSRSNSTGPDGWAARWGLPLLFGLVFLGAWEWLVAVTETPAYVLPGRWPSGPRWFRASGR